MKWTDYAVPKWGTDKTYASPITGGVGNELRYPKDYMAFFSDRTDYTQLCTDYRNGNGECLRYEMNTDKKAPVSDFQTQGFYCLNM